ncbi:MAG TPA: CHAT domain-containing protein [Pyrinomonadaceae bacterium]|nr:CHAT domain-containing protein [Pyrinomonadaceae bacterium]
MRLLIAFLKIIICLSLITLAEGAGLAQDEAEREFEEAVNQYTVSYRALMMSRGAASRIVKRRRVSETETLREISQSFLVRGAPPLSEYVRSASLPDVAAALIANFPARTALIFYAYRNEKLQVWLVTQSGLAAYSERELTQQKLEAVIYDLRNSLGVDSLQAARAPVPVKPVESPRPAPDVRLKLSPERAIAEATALLLPPPVAARLDSVRHLIVAPILGLGTVPFALLRPFDSDAFLIDRMSVSVVPSLFDIETAVSRWKPRYANGLVIGNPYLPPDSSWRVPPLPGAEEEALAIGRMIKARPLVGRRATKREIMMRAARADFLYFATHGVASSDDPLTGGFLFLTARSLKRGFWTAREVQGLRLKAQLAVLSACQTGLGKIHDAGVIGLSRAFQIAGVPRVVMSLWSVNDKATAQLMKAFVKYLESNMPSEALRLAMLEVRRDRPNPAHWASFVLFGTPR